MHQLRAAPCKETRAVEAGRCRPLTPRQQGMGARQHARLSHRQFCRCGPAHCLDPGQIAIQERHPLQVQITTAIPGAHFCLPGVEVTPWRCTLTLESLDGSKCLRCACQLADCHVFCLLAPASQDGVVAEVQLAFSNAVCTLSCRKELLEAAGTQSPLSHWLTAPPQSCVCRHLLTQPRSLPCRVTTISCSSLSVSLNTLV